MSMCGGQAQLLVDRRSPVQEEGRQSTGNPTASPGSGRGIPQGHIRSGHGGMAEGFACAEALRPEVEQQAQGNYCGWSRERRGWGEVSGAAEPRGPPGFVLVR